MPTLERLDDYDRKRLADAGVPCAFAKGQAICTRGKAEGAKCARCWGYFGGLGADDRHPELCPRCTPIVIEKDPDLRVPAKKAEEVAA